MELKRCYKCELERPTSDFYKDLQKKDKLQGKCKFCEKQYCIDNQERIRNRNKQQYIIRKSLNQSNTKIIKHRHHKNKILKQKQETRIKSKDEILKQKQEYRIKNKSKILLHMKLYRSRNKTEISKRNKLYRQTPEGIAAQHRCRHRRRDLTKSLPCTLTADQWRKILIMQNNKCDDCGKEFTDDLPPTKDHIIPLSSGRHNAGFTMENIRALCTPCNNKKLAKIDKELIQSWL